MNVLNMLLFWFIVLMGIIWWSIAIAAAIGWIVSEVRRFRAS